MNTQIVRLFQHLAWADQETLAALEHTARPHPEACRLFSHLLAAEHIWLSRIQGQPPALPSAWPTLSAAECREWSTRTRAGYSTVVASVTEDQLQDQVSYHNLQGLAFQTPLGDILMHVALHGAYHRGQIAAALRQAGHQPANTDFITFARLNQ